MNSERKLTFEELVELVPRVYSHSISSLEPITPTAKRRINESLLLKLRRLDYLSRDRLNTFMCVLLREQERTRKNSKESLYRFVSIIDQAETAIQENEFEERLLKTLLELEEQQEAGE